MKKIYLSEEQAQITNIYLSSQGASQSTRLCNEKLFLTDFTIIGQKQFPRIPKLRKGVNLPPPFSIDVLPTVIQTR